MKALIIYAHHEPSSFTGALKNAAVETLTAQGHSVEVSDLYGMGFQATAEKWDFSTLAPDHFNYARQQEFAAGHDWSYAADIVGEMQKLRDAETVLFIYPLWWGGMPAIMKGWLDRVLAKGFAWSDAMQYQGGGMFGKTAMCVVAAGEPAPEYRPGGKYGMTVEQLLNPLHSHVFAFCGFNIAEPFVAYNVNGANDAARQTMLDGFRMKMNSLASAPRYLIKLTGA